MDGGGAQEEGSSRAGEIRWRLGTGRRSVFLEVAVKASLQIIESSRCRCLKIQAIEREEGEERSRGGED